MADEEAGGGLGASCSSQHATTSPTAPKASARSVLLDRVGDQRSTRSRTARRHSWFKLTARGTAGHGSYISPTTRSSAGEAVARIGNHEFPCGDRHGARVSARSCRRARIELDVDDPEATVAKLGNLGRLVGATLRNTANRPCSTPATSTTSCRSLLRRSSTGASPGSRRIPRRDRRAARAGREARVRTSRRRAETPFSGSLVDRCARRCSRGSGREAGAVLLSGGTDAKSLSRLGIVGYGSRPWRCRRNSTSSGCSTGRRAGAARALRFGCRVLDRFLPTLTVDNSIPRIELSHPCDKPGIA